MYHPTTRVLTILEVLQARGRVSGPELATHIDVDIRTLRRYIALLQELGIPIAAGRGRYGAYQLRLGFKLPPLMVGEDEALAVSSQKVGGGRYTEATESEPDGACICWMRWI